MSRERPILMGSLTAFALSACVSVDPSAYPNDPNARSRQGVVTGALLGGFIGLTQDKRGGKLDGVLLGAALGAAAGGTIGQTLDKQAAELRAKMSDPRVSITNTGQSLIVTLPQDILFATNSTELKGTLISDLYAVAHSLQNYPDSAVEIIGHTDNTGAAQYNQDLSVRRALSVTNVLRNAGVPGTRIMAAGYGEDQPVVSNATDAGRTQNRRVEIVIRPNI